MFQNLFSLKKIRWLLVAYDLAISIFTHFIYYIIYPIAAKNAYASLPSDYLLSVLYHFALSCFILFFCRLIGKVYYQIWRYGGISSYIRLLVSDFFGLLVFIGVEFSLSNIPGFLHFNVILLISCQLTTLLISISLRMLYRFMYRYLTKDTKLGHLVVKIVKIFGRVDFDILSLNLSKKIKIAIVGAGRTGVGLAEELLGTSNSVYSPALFVETSRDKSGRIIYDIPVVDEKKITLEILDNYEIQEIVFALPNLSSEDKNTLFNSYKKFGRILKLYDYPLLFNSKNKKTLRQFDIEELLFRKPISLEDSKVDGYYKDKTILITGGGGSIGGEIAKQIATMSPRQLVLLDVFENGVYEVQQDLKIKYKDALKLSIEICSITNIDALRMVFNSYKFDIIIHAAAHKHVPLMEHNSIEAIENNIFGTNNLLNLVEEFRVSRFMLISTDKAVNPTNIMGATKRFCEINTFSRANCNRSCIYSATRFGNVLGSAGSVIPLFKKQIASGGPVTLTDKRIVRYFMTIPEASRLVLASGAMAKNGELFVLDMGQPIKIYDLAEALITLSGLIPNKDIQIVEEGLRPGEKLFEELLTKSDTLTKTDNDLIFIEKDDPISLSDLHYRLDLLSQLVTTRQNNKIQEAMSLVVPTYKKNQE